MKTNENEQARETGNATLLPKTLPGRGGCTPDTNISWFHGRITRDAAEHILRVNGGKEGTFLLRESTSSCGDYVLSLIHSDQPIHYQIRRHGDDAYFSIDEGPIIHGLEVLVSYYQEGSNGLVTRLGPMCKGQPPPPESRRHGRTNLLHRATKEGNCVVVSELLRNSYHSLDAKNQEGQTAVHLACIIGHEQILQILLEAGANINCRDSNGLTPLHYACRENRPTLVQILLEGGASAHLRSLRNGWVPLHEAASQGFLDVVNILLTFGVPCQPRSNTNETPIELATKNGHAKCVKMLQHHQPPPPKSTRVEWFHENLDREQTCTILQNTGLIDGTFLVRRSTRKAGVYVLSTVSNTHIYHFEIHQREKHYFIDDGPYLESLEQLIDYYRTSADGLPAHLTTPIRPCQDVSEGKEHLKNDNLNEIPISKTLEEKSDSEPNLILRESLRLGPPIGDGEFGSVLGGIWVDSKNNHKKVAIKMLREEHIKNGRTEFIREVEVMVGLNHRCIVQLLGVCLGPPLMMVQEYVPMGSMLDYLLDFPDEVDVEKDLKLWATQIALGMMYLESKRFVHRDLAARNILLESKQQAKISDFGLSRSLRDGSEYYKATSGGRWPIKWYAPESVNYGTFSHASDVWSYGVTLWEMFSYGEQPYGEMTGAQVIQLIEANQRLAKPETCPDNVYALMMKCWSYKPENRPLFNDLYETFNSNLDNGNAL